MSEIGRWNGHRFEVSTNLVRGFTGLTIKGSSETEDKDAGGEMYASRKNGKPKEVKLEILLASYLGCDVRTEAIQFVDEATSGRTGYFYVGNKKLVTCQMMLTEASVKDVKIVGNGTWTSAVVSLTMKQCSKNDVAGTAPGVPTSGGGSSQRVSVNTTPPVKAAVTGAAMAVAAGLSFISQKNTAVVTSATNAIVKAATAVVKSVSSVAKAATSASKTSSSSTTSAKSFISRITSSWKKR